MFRVDTGAPQLHDLGAIRLQRPEVELLSAVVTQIFLRVKPRLEAVRSHDRLRLLMDHQQMIADRVELIHIQPGLEGFGESLFQFDIEDLKTKTLRLKHFLRINRQTASVNIATAGSRKDAVTNADIA